MKKILIISLLIGLMVLAGCSSNLPGNTGNQDVVLQKFKIASNGRLPDSFCDANGLEGKVVMIESKYCSHCQENLPVFKKVAGEHSVDVEILDLAVKEDYDKLSSYNLEVQYTPTYLYDCNFYVGSQTEESFNELFNSLEN